VTHLLGWLLVGVVDLLALLYIAYELDREARAYDAPGAMRYDK